ncbi:hypothetical protein OBBRIDRAFT_756735 [Obba rivulosa]|uniref:Tim44-like domain-containing protein n=1 Tax=Obba rivulosa TaxID=1052685 RepID=A0A8E2AWE5_9APHY|nr:hypothetical protein OBBRIDRAFT_756735 [Obba rivulosa]
MSASRLSARALSSDLLPFSAHSRFAHPLRVRRACSHRTYAASALKKRKTREDPKRNDFAERLQKGEIDDEETKRVLQNLEAIRVMGDELPFDPWAQGSERFDVHIPSWRSHKPGATLRDHLTTISLTLKNWGKNIMSMRHLASHNSFPGTQVASPLSLEVFRASSVAPTGWTAGIRARTLETYAALHAAVARRDDKAIKRLAMNDALERYLALARASDPNAIAVWAMHPPSSSASAPPPPTPAPAHNSRTIAPPSEVSPATAALLRAAPEAARILSIRAQQAHFGIQDPKRGSRFMVQALVRFDTVQTLHIYSKRGQLLHEAPPKRVVEHLVFQKRMWYDAPWVVRERIVPGAQ